MSFAVQTALILTFSHGEKELPPNDNRLHNIEDVAAAWKASSLEDVSLSLKERAEVRVIYRELVQP